MSDATSRALRVGTRASELALHQAELARTAIETAAAGALEVELVPMTSEGDRDPRDLRDIGERGVFAAHLERALEAGEIDAAVHSSKDLQLQPHPTLVLAAWLPRADPRDALVGVTGAGLDALVNGAVVATGSSRRCAALRTLRPDVTPSPIRGNVHTRIRRAAERGDAACLLAKAGLDRLGITASRDDVVALPVDKLVPEAGQGAVVIQTRAYTCDRTGFDWSRIDDVATRRTVQLERELARRFDGGCSRPIGVHVQLDAGRVLVFAAADADAVGRTVSHDVLGLDLAPLLSVSSATDIEDAIPWVADRIMPELTAQLGWEVRA